MAFGSAWSTAAQFVLLSVLSDQSSQQYEDFQAAVDQKVEAGLSIAEARVRVALELFDNSPEFAEARDTLRELYGDLPGRFLDDYDESISTGKADLKAYENRIGELGEGFKKREADVMGLLEGQGAQALKDIERDFGSAQSESLSDLASRGLAGSGVGASIRGGFTTRKADAIGRERERAALTQANALSRLRGEGLGFGFDSAGRILGGANDLRSARERALAQAYGFEYGAGSQLADALYGQGNNALDVFLGTTGDQMDYIQGINDIPPDTSYIGPAVASTTNALLPR